MFLITNYNITVSKYHKFALFSSYDPVISIADGSVNHNKTKVRDSCEGHYGHPPGQVTGWLVRSFIQPSFITHLQHTRGWSLSCYMTLIVQSVGNSPSFPMIHLHILIRVTQLSVKLAKRVFLSTFRIIF